MTDLLQTCRFSLHETLIDGLEMCGILVDYGDVFIRSFGTDGTVRPGSIDPMTAVVQRVKGFAYYSLSFSRHNKNIKMEGFFLYILSRYFIWLHKWKGFNDICASLKHERMIDYSFQLLLILYPLRCRETISLRGPVFHRSHGHNLVRPGHQSEVNYGYVSKICR